MTIAINKRKKYLFWFLLAITALIAVRVAIKARENSPARDVEQIKQEINQGLPLGTHRDSVDKWLSARGYQHGMAEEMQNPGRIVGICALVPKSYFWYGTGEIRFWFEFDDNGRLVKSSVHWFEFSL